LNKTILAPTSEFRMTPSQFYKKIEIGVVWSDIKTPDIGGGKWIWERLSGHPSMLI
jgi:hypothetical protein